ncbi:MAG: AI-2E family transporter [Bacillota bacterium]|nr:AI-2E family transporter [Bacillota bacterium]MDW7729028.1 AI-2E family transporter [Bacillota bacterium]
MMDKNWSIATRMIGLLAFIAAAIWLLNSLSWLVGLILISIIIVYILHPILTWMKERFNLRHGPATVIVFTLFILFCVFVLSLVIPVIIYEVSELIDAFPHYAERFQEFLSWFSQQTINLDIEEEVRNYLINLTDNLHQALEYIAEASMSLIGGAIDFFLVLFLVFYLLYDFQAVREQIVGLVPLAKKTLAEEILLIIDTNAGTFIRGSLIRCTIVGIVTGIVLAIVGMPYALLLGMLAGLFNFILYIGPYIAAVPALLLSFSPLTPSPLVVIIVYVVIQVLDGMFLAPIVLGRIVKLKPITVIIAILAGGRLAGLLGMVLAVPVAGIIKNIIELLKRGSAYRSEEKS